MPIHLMVPICLYYLMVDRQKYDKPPDVFTNRGLIFAYFTSRFSGPGFDGYGVFVRYVPWKGKM